MADCNVAIHTHGAEGEYAGEHIVVVYGDHNLAQDGSKRTAVDIIADNVEFLSSAQNGAPQTSQSDGYPTPPPEPSANSGSAFTSSNGFTQVPNDDLPF